MKLLAKIKETCFSDSLSDQWTHRLTNQKDASIFRRFASQELFSGTIQLFSICSFVAMVLLK
jgi:hypothetical protein